MLWRTPILIKWPSLPYLLGIVNKVDPESAVYQLDIVNKKVPEMDLDEA